MNNRNSTSHLLPTLDTSPTEISMNKNNMNLGDVNIAAASFTQNCSESGFNFGKDESYQSKLQRAIKITSPSTVIKKPDFKEAIIDGFTICSFKNEQDLLAYAKQQESSSMVDDKNAAKPRAKKKHSRIHDTSGKRRHQKAALDGSKPQESSFNVASNVSVSVLDHNISAPELPMEYRNGHLGLSLSKFAPDSTEASYSSMQNLSTTDNHSVLSQLCDTFLPSTTTSAGQKTSLFANKPVSLSSAKSSTGDVARSDSVTRNNYPHCSVPGIWDTGYTQSIPTSGFSTLAVTSNFLTPASIGTNNARDCHLTPLSTSWNVQSEDPQRNSSSRSPQVPEFSNGISGHCDRSTRVSSTGSTTIKSDNGYHYFSVAALTDERDSNSNATPFLSPSQRPRSNTVAHQEPCPISSTAMSLSSSNAPVTFLPSSPTKGLNVAVDCSKKRAIPFYPVSSESSSSSSCSVTAQNGISSASRSNRTLHRSPFKNAEHQRIAMSRSSEAVNSPHKAISSKNNHQNVTLDSVSPRLDGTRPAPNIAHTCSIPLLSPDVLQGFIGVNLETAEQLSRDAHFKELYSSTMARLMDLGQSEIPNQDAAKKAKLFQDAFLNYAATSSHRNEWNSLVELLSSSTTHHLPPTNHFRDTVPRMPHAEERSAISGHPTDLRVLTSLADESTGIQQRQHQAERKFRSYSNESLRSPKSSSSAHQTVLVSAKSTHSDFRYSPQKVLGRPPVVHPISNASSSSLGKPSSSEPGTNRFLPKTSTNPGLQQQSTSRLPLKRETTTSDLMLQNQWEAYMRHLASSTLYPGVMPVPTLPNASGSTSRSRFLRRPLPNNNIDQSPIPVPPDYSLWRATTASISGSSSTPANVKIRGFLYQPVYPNKSYGRWADAHIRIAIFILSMQAIRMQSSKNFKKAPCADQVSQPVTYRSSVQLHKPLARRLPPLMPCPAAYPTANCNPIRPSFPPDLGVRSNFSHPSSVPNRLYSPTSPSRTGISYWNRFMGDFFATLAAEMPATPPVPNTLSDVPWPSMPQSNHVNPFTQQPIVSSGGYLPTVPNVGPFPLPFLSASTSSLSTPPIPLNSVQNPKFNPPPPSMSVPNSKRRRLDCPRSSIQPIVPLEGPFHQNGPGFNFSPRGNQVINTAASLLNSYRTPSSFLPSAVPVPPNSNSMLRPPAVHSSHLAPIHPW